MNKKTLVSVLAFACFTVSGRAADAVSTAREVVYHTGDIIPLNAQHGYATLVELPLGEKGVMPICGDCKVPSADGSVSKDSIGSWVIQVAPETNLVSIAATRPGAKTDVHVLGSSGEVYTFTVREISQLPGEHVDIRVHLSREGQPAMPVQVKYVSASTADEYKNEAEKAKRELKEQEAAAQQTIAATRDQARQQIEANIRHEYTWSENKKAAGSFGFRSMYVVDGFTVIEATPQEAPALYEVKDGKDSLIQYTLVNGKYVAPKLINDGYLQVGKSKLTFHREAKNND